MGKTHYYQKSIRMKKIASLIQTDLRQIFRDKTLTVFLFTPVLLIIFVRLFVPYITQVYPAIEPFHPMVMMFAGIQTAIMFGFIVSFILLEEKDEYVLQVIRVLPISPFHFILYRLLFATLFSALGAFLMINLGGIAYPGLLNSLLLSFQYGLTAPFITLIIATYAKNKIEGMAFFKGIDLILLLPMLSFFLAGNIKYVFSVIPAYWTYNLFNASLTQGNTVSFFLVGLFVYSAVITVLFFQFKKRIFDR
jgi:hypothetical protein